MLFAANIGRSAFSARTLVKTAHSGAAPQSGRSYVVFVTYSDMPYVAEYVFRHLDFLNRAGFNVVVVSNSKKVNPQSLRELRLRSAAVLERPNIGYDFGAYRDGVIWLLQNYDQIDRILLMNDSVFGPVSLETDFCAKALALDADIVGLIESMETRYHFQSFWVMFNAGAISSKKFADYWRSMSYYSDKLQVVDKLETRLVNYFLQQDFRAESLFAVDHVTKKAMANFLAEIEALSKSAGESLDAGAVRAEGGGAGAAERVRLTQRGAPLRARLDYLRQILGILSHGVAMNPTVFMWRTLLQDFRFPYVKREIFTRNPVSEPNILSAYDVTGACGYPVELIRSYLRGAR
jgi:hypothetical protein